MIDLDLPAVEVDLEQWASGAVQIGAEQISGLAIVPACAVAFAIGSGGDDEQAQGAGPGTALPQHWGGFFIADGAALAAIEDPGGAPADLLVLAHQFGSKLIGAVDAPALTDRGQAEFGILAGTGNQ